MVFGNSTPLVRSWSNTLQSLLFALVLLGSGAFLLFENWSVKADLAAVILLFIGALALWAAVSASYTGNCPACGARQKRVGGLHRCDTCLAYGEVVKNEYCEIEPDRVAKNAVFFIQLPEQWNMPMLCCACGAAATRLDKLRIIRKEFAFDTGAPHCGLHSGGADLATEYSSDKGKEIPILKVASYSFYREFLRNNGLVRS